MNPLGYIDNNLLADENIVYKTRLHKIIFFYPVLWMVIAIAAWFLIPGDERELAGFPIKVEDLKLGVTAIFAAMSLLQGFVIYLRYISSEFAVTDQRLIVKTGLVRRSTFELFLKRLEGVQVNQSVTGRILGYGTITASGTGGLQDSFEMISSPLEFRGNIQKCASEFN